MTTIPPLGSLDITGRPTLRVVMPVPAGTKAEIEKRGITAPDKVILYLREATLREKKAYFAESNDMTDADMVGWTARLLKARCEDDVPLEVFEELVLDMGDSILGVVQEMYVSGRMTDPKLMGGAVRATKAKFTDAALSAMQTEPLASSPITESAPGNAAN